jgi:hypothetical protein
MARFLRCGVLNPQRIIHPPIPFVNSISDLRRRPAMTAEAGQGVAHFLSSPSPATTSHEEPRYAHCTAHRGSAPGPEGQGQKGPALFVAPR